MIQLPAECEREKERRELDLTRPFAPGTHKVRARKEFDTGSQVQVWCKSQSVEFLLLLPGLNMSWLTVQGSVAAVLCWVMAPMPPGTAPVFTIVSGGSTSLG